MAYRYPAFYVAWICLESLCGWSFAGGSFAVYVVGVEHNMWWELRTICGGFCAQYVVDGAQDMWCLIANLVIAFAISLALAELNNWSE